MSCASCKSGSPRVSYTPVANASASVIEPFRTLNVMSFNSVTGNKVHYPKTLVSQRPAQGWAGAFTINGVTVTIKGATPEAAILSLVNVATANGLKMSPQEAWLWLNHYWMMISEVKRHLVNFNDVAAAVTSEGGSGMNIVARNWVEDYTPAKWGAVAWRWFGFLLVPENADLAEFEKALKLVEDRLNPEVSPLTGCVECYTHFMEAKAEKPEFTDVMSARAWLWKFHNSVNVRIRKPSLTWIKACQENMWAYNNTQTPEA